MKRSSRNLEEEQDVLEIGEGILTRNLGLDVIVVVTKVRHLNYHVVIDRIILIMYFRVNRQITW